MEAKTMADKRLGLARKGECAGRPLPTRDFSFPIGGRSIPRFWAAAVSCGPHALSPHFVAGPSERRGGGA